MMDTWDENAWPGERGDFGDAAPAFLATALDERSLRRPTWSSGETARLNNGQVWHFPRVGIVEALLSPDLHGLIAAFPAQTAFATRDPRSWVAQLAIDAALRPIAAHLLAFNYEVGIDGALALVGYPLLFQGELDLAIANVLNASEDVLIAFSPHLRDSVLFPN